MDEALRPSFKAAFSLSMDKFRKWRESASNHFEAICEKEFYENCLELDTYQEMVEESTHVYNKRVSVFIRRSEFMNARREESESYLSYYHRLRKLADMAVVREINDKQLVMHMLIQSLLTNVLKTLMQQNRNPDLDDVVAMLELMKQQMRQLGQSNFPLP